MKRHAYGRMAYLVFVVLALTSLVAVLAGPDQNPSPKAREAMDALGGALAICQQYVFALLACGLPAAAVNLGLPQAGHVIGSPQCNGANRIFSRLTTEQQDQCRVVAAEAVPAAEYYIP